MLAAPRLAKTPAYSLDPPLPAPLQARAGSMHFTIRTAIVGALTARGIERQHMAAELSRLAGRSRPFWARWLNNPSRRIREDTADSALRALGITLGDSARGSD